MHLGLSLKAFGSLRSTTVARPSFATKSLAAFQTKWNVSTLSAKDIEISKTTQPRTKLPNKELVFGKTMSDHILEIEWTQESGWGKPKISPYHNLSLDPACTVFHYGMECFEGMKAYKDGKNKVRLFRPNKNMDRLHDSCTRLTLPSFDKGELLKCIKELVKVEKDWIPSEKGYSLYIRPTCIATQPSLGVGASSRALMYVICCPVGPYYKTGFSAVSLKADPAFVRAWPGGTGNAKVGGNYAPTIYPQLQAISEGHQQILWLYGPNHDVTEVGTMNLFTFWINENGEKELITPPLDGTILPGVTRDSILSICREWGEFNVSEKPYSMKHLVKASQEGRLLEMFGAGTACIVAPIKNIEYQGKSIKVPLDPSNPSSQAGPLTKRLSETILSIQYGELEHDFSVVVD